MNWNWLQILTSIVNAVPELEKDGIEVIQLITAIAHSAQSGNAAPITAAAAAVEAAKPKG